MTMEWYWLLWPISGWLCGFLSTQTWMMKDWIAIPLLLFAGAVVGPFGILWFFDSTARKWGAE